MEHEDNAQFDNYLQNAQQQNLQLGNNNTGNGDALVGLGLNVEANNVGCGGAIGEVNMSKYDDMEDESEWKILKEVNQNEKNEQSGDNIMQQQQEMVGNGKNHGIPLHDDDDDDEDDYDNEGMPSMQYRNNGNDEHHNGASKDDFEAMQTDVGDFSQTSNTASTAEGGCNDMLQVEMKIEPAQQLQQQQEQHLFDEEDPSSNGTSSLSENAPMPQQLTATFDLMAENNDFMQNKENADPQSPVMRPTELNFETVASHLNPDAKEFVPSFGSNATSPTMSETADVEQHVGEPLSALPRHRLLSGDDDILAHSPRKGREIDMGGENLVLPHSEFEFDNELKKRPHEFEEEEDHMCNPLEISQSPLAENLISDDDDVVSSSPTNIHQNHDHHDHDMDELLPVNEQNLIENDVMKQSIYMAENGDVAQNESIEDVLNSVQPLPTDIESLNSSFVEDVFAGTPEELRAIDLLSNEIDVDGEHISHPPSIEEMQMNLQNVNNKEDLAQEDAMNLDMNSAEHMQESFYMEQQAQQTVEEEQQEQKQRQDDAGLYAEQFAANESLLLDRSTPFKEPEQQQDQDMFINNNDFSDNAKVMDYDEQNIVTNMSSPSPKSTVEEKHLMEETKEQLVAKTIQDGQQFVEELGKKMENLLSPDIDSDLKQELATVTQLEEEPIQLQNNESKLPEQFELIDSTTHDEVNEHKNEMLPKVEQQEPIVLDLQTEQIEQDTAKLPAAEVVDEKTVIIAATAAVVATTAVAAAAVTAAQVDKKSEKTVKKPTATKSSTSTTAAAAAKKPTTTVKPIAKTTTNSTAAAPPRPRTAPAKVAATSTAAKKPATATTTTTASKTSLAAKPLASRAGSTTARLSATTSTAARKASPTTRTAASTTAAKPRSASAQPLKPTTAAAAAATTGVKPKISPRATLTSQLRNKVAPTGSTTTTTTTTKATTVKSPTKPTASSVGATRAKSATSTAAGTTSTTNKLFTARPAPKTTATGLGLTARSVSKTSPLKTSPAANRVAAARVSATNLKAKATTKDAIKSPAQITRKTPTKTAVASKPSKDAEKEPKVAQTNGVKEEKVAVVENADESFKLQNGSVEANPIEIDGQV